MTTTLARRAKRGIRWERGRERPYRVPLDVRSAGGLGLSPSFTLGMDAIIAAAPAERAGAAALSETSSEQGGALGIDVLGSVATGIYRRCRLHSMLGSARPFR